MAHYTRSLNTNRFITITIFSSKKQTLIHNFLQTEIYQPLFNGSPCLQRHLWSPENNSYWLRLSTGFSSCATSRSKFSSTGWIWTECGTNIYNCQKMFLNDSSACHSGFSSNASTWLAFGVYNYYMDCHETCTDVHVPLMKNCNNFGELSSALIRSKF